MHLVISMMVYIALTLHVIPFGSKRPMLSRPQTTGCQVFSKEEKVNGRGEKNKKGKLLTRDEELRFWNLGLRTLIDWLQGRAVSASQTHYS